MNNQLSDTQKLIEAQRVEAVKRFIKTLRYTKQDNIIKVDDDYLFTSSKGKELVFKVFNSLHDYIVWYKDNAGQQEQLKRIWDYYIVLLKEKEK